MSLEIFELKKIYKELISMASIEKKVRAFVNDENKVRALSSDGAFMDKVSAGTATPQDIAKKFGELELPLTEEQAEKISKTASIILEKTPIAQMEDSDLDSVSGGYIESSEILTIAGFAAGGAGALGALGCNIAGAVCQHKAKKAATEGNMAKSNKYNSVASKLNIASITCGGVAATGTGLGLGIGGYAYIKD